MTNAAWRIASFVNRQSSIVNRQSSIVNSMCGGVVEVEVDCPYCGEPVSLWIDETGGRVQAYVEDCTVCCRPIHVSARYDGEEFDVSVQRADDAG
jgi:cysteine-rich CPXCG protein